MGIVWGEAYTCAVLFKIQSTSDIRDSDIRDFRL